MGPTADFPEDYSRHTSSSIGPRGTTTCPNLAKWRAFFYMKYSSFDCQFAGFRSVVFCGCIFVQTTSVDIRAATSVPAISHPSTPANPTTAFLGLPRLKTRG